MKANGPSTSEGVDYKEGINLLDAGSSDSEVQEHFALPPLNLKGGRKKRKRPSSVGCCNMKCILVSVCLLALLVGYLGLAYYAWSLGQQLQALKISVNGGTVECPGSSEKLTALEKKQHDLEESLSSGRATNMKAIEQINLKISEINSTTSLLSKRLSTVSLSENLPKDVADIGSQMKALEGRVKSLEDLLSDISSHLQELTKIVSPLPSGSEPPTLSSKENNLANVDSLTKELSQVEQTVQAMNSSLYIELAYIKINAAQHLIAINELHNSSKDLQDRLALVELRAAPTSPEDASQNMRELVENAVTTAMEEQQSKTADNIMYVNSTISDLNAKFENYHNHNLAVIKQTNAIVVRLTQQVTNLENRIEVDESRLLKLETSPPKEILPSESRPVEGNMTNPVMTSSPATAAVVNQSEPEQIITLVETSTSPLPVSTSVTMKSADSRTGQPVKLQMSGIDTYLDVQKKFFTWDTDSDRLVTYADIVAIERENAPDESILKTFDLNNDDNYDLDEIGTAFGFPPIPKKKKVPTATLR